MSSGYIDIPQITGGIVSINGDTTAAQTIVGGAGISVSTSAGTTTISNTEPATYTFADSIVNTSGTVTLVNDSPTPGDSMYYGTNASGVLGYFPMTDANGFTYLAGNTSVYGGTNSTLSFTGPHNTVVGVESGNSSISGGYTTGLGAATLVDLTTGSYNTAIGALALQSTTTGSYNVAIGVNALNENITGDNNIAIGANSLYQNANGDNIAIGFEAMFGGGGGYETIAIGTQAALLGSPVLSVCIGYQAGAAMTGDFNTCIGYQTGYQMTNSGNVALGAEAMTGMHGYNNVAVGYTAMINGADNYVNNSIAIGYGATVNGATNTTYIGVPGSTITSIMAGSFVSQGAMTWAYQRVVATSGGSTTANNGVSSFILANTSLLTTYTLTMPAGPYDGQLFYITTNGGATSLTLSPSAGQSIIGAISALSAGGFAQYQWINSDSSWYRVG